MEPHKTLLLNDDQGPRRLWVRWLLVFSLAAVSLVDAGSLEANDRGQVNGGLNKIDAFFEEASRAERDSLVRQKPQVTVLEREDPGELPEVPSYLRLERNWQSGTQCGPVALYFFLRLQNVNTSLDEVLNQVETDESGSSMASLQNAAIHFGLEGVSVASVTPEQLSSLTTPFIIHWDTQGTDNQVGHFDVVTRVHESGAIDIIDTTNCVRKRVEMKAAVPQMSGYVLLSARSRHPFVAALWLLFYIVLFANLGLGGYFVFMSMRRRTSS